MHEYDPAVVEFNDLEPFQSSPFFGLLHKGNRFKLHYERLLCTDTIAMPKLGLTNVAFPSLPSILAPSPKKFKLC